MSFKLFLCIFQYERHLLFQVRIAVVTYSDVAQIEFYLNTYSRDKMATLNAMRLPHNGGRTNAQMALALVHNEIFATRNGDRTGVKNVGVFVSDGYSNISPENIIHEVSRLNTTKHSFVFFPIPFYQRHV